MRRSLASVALFVFAASGLLVTRAAENRISQGSNEESRRHGRRFPLVERFETNPSHDPTLVLKGAASARVTWEDSEAAWPGDSGGSVSALYDSSLPAALFGFRLPEPLDEHDAFTAAATFVLDPDGFSADPYGFFQIAWGLYNTRTTGLDRTGDFSSFAADTFDLLEFDYFPNVSPDFGGPFLSPTMFGENANPAAPDSYSNASFTFGLQVSLPFGVPLLAVIRHEPDLDVAVVSVYRIVRPRRTIPIPGAVTVLDLSALASRKYDLDAVGLTLWNDGFGGPSPALHAKVAFHSLVVQRGVVEDVDSLLSLTSRGRW